MADNVSDPTLRRRLVTTAVWIVLLLLVFGVILPQIIDYEATWNAIKGLAFSEVAILVMLGFMRIATEGLQYWAILPELSPFNSSRAWLMVNGSTMFLPVGADRVAFYAVASTEGVESRRALTTALLFTVYPTIGRFLLPLIVIAPFLIFAVASDETVIVFVVLLAVAVAVGTVGYLVVRSEATAHGLGNFASLLVNAVMRRLGRDPVDSFGPALVRFRSDAIEQIAAGWRRSLIAIPLNHLSIFVILLLSLRFIGFSDDQMPWVEVLAAYGLSQWAMTVLPISPAGGLGIADFVLLATLTPIAGGNENEVAAAIVLWRIFYWALPIPIGLLAIDSWRRAHPDALDEARSVFARREDERRMPD